MDQSTNQNFKPLFDFLERSPEYESLTDALSNARGPVGVFGLGEAHRTHIAAALHAKLAGTTLIVAPSAQSAQRLFEVLACYHKNTLLFPIRETPLNARSYVQSQELTNRRLRVLLALISGESALIVAPVEAVMQRMCPPEAIRAHTLTGRVGMEITPDALLRRFIDAG